MYVVRRENCYNVMVRVSELLRNDGIETVSLKSRGLSPPTSRPFLFARSQEAGHQCSDLAFLYSPNNSLVPCNYPVKRSVGFPNPGLNYLNELPCLAPPSFSASSFISSLSFSNFCSSCFYTFAYRTVSGDSQKSEK